MSDILDTIDDETEEADALEGEIVDFGDEMSESEAEEVTEAIRSTVTATYVLLARAHEGRAYKALGYDTWGEYVKEEFDFSTQRSYQLLDLAKTIKAIEEVAPEGTEVTLTEAQARDIKRELPRITESIREETQEKTPEEASDVIDDVIEESREQKKADEEVLAEKERKKEEAELERERKELEEEADSFLAADDASGMSDSADGDFLEVDVEGEDGNLSPRDSISLHNFFAMVSNYDGLPEPSEMIGLIPQEREDEVEKVLIDITGWFNSFQTLWEDQKN